jgi:hypothetical protein
MVDNNNQDEYQRSEIKPPWRVSQKGAVWCPWQNIPDDISSQLKMEHGFKMTIGGFSYYVRENEDGSYIVFRNTSRNSRAGSTKGPMYRVSEIQMLPIEEANKLLASSNNQFELVGIDPIKVIDQQFFVALGKKEKVG